MTLPAVRITEIDGALGALPPSLGRPLALVGVTDDGPVAQPALFAGSAGQKAILATFKGGPTVEAACRALALGVGVALVRTAASTPGSYPEDDAVVTTGAGTATVTVDTASPPNDDYEAFVMFTAGATIGQAGAEYRWSLDGGRTLSPPTALGTADAIELPGSGVVFEFDAGTVLTGQTLYCRTAAPKWSTSDLTAALSALRTSSIRWEIAAIVGDLTPTDFDAVELAFAEMRSAGKDRLWVGHVRNPEDGESESTYRTALDAAWATKASVFGGITAGAAEIVSAVSGRIYQRPTGPFDFAAGVARLSEELDIAELDHGLRAGVSIRDQNGNPKHHDEASSPGLDDLRFITLRTHEEVQGVYYTNPRLFAPAGSDFEFVQHRRVMNLAREALRGYMKRRLSKPVRVARASGFILEEDAIDIEIGATRILEAVLLAKPKASGARFTLSRTDNLLSTKTLTCSAKITPLSYPKDIDLDMSFENPALQTVAV